MRVKFTATPAMPHYYGSGVFVDGEVRELEDKVAKQLCADFPKNFRETKEAIGAPKPKEPEKPKEGAPGAPGGQGTGTPPEGDKDAQGGQGEAGEGSGKKPETPKGK